MKQYYYLVTHRTNKEQIVDKIFLQQHEAIRYGRKMAIDEDSVFLYKQEITRNGILEYMYKLYPYAKIPSVE